VAQGHLMLLGRPLAHCGRAGARSMAPETLVLRQRAPETCAQVLLPLVLWQWLAAVAAGVGAVAQIGRRKEAAAVAVVMKQSEEN